MEQGTFDWSFFLSTVDFCARYFRRIIEIVLWIMFLGKFMRNKSVIFITRNNINGKIVFLDILGHLL